MQYKVAKAWGKTPSEWALLNKKDKTTMMAFDRAEDLIESWHSEEMEKRIKSVKKGKTAGRQPKRYIDKRRISWAF